MRLAGERGVRVGLFVTCLVDLMRPSVGFAAVKLLEDAGCSVEVPSQTCCGQPAYNTGDRATTRDLAERVIESFRGFDYVVAPSGSCAGMIKVHYPELFMDDPNWAPRANELASRTFELTSFLVDVLGVTAVAARFSGPVTYHDSCSGLRELGEIADSDVCCGFGGTFAVKYGDISNAIVEDKTKRIAETGAPTLLAGDLGCLLNIAGKLSREGRTIEVRHVAEVLAGLTHDPPIGMPRDKAAT